MMKQGKSPIRTEAVWVAEDSGLCNAAFGPDLTTEILEKANSLLPSGKSKQDKEKNSDRNDNEKRGRTEMLVLLRTIRIRPSSYLRTAMRTSTKAHHAASLGRGRSIDVRKATALWADNLFNRHPLDSLALWPVGAGVR
jgi:hypothetical protein